jgi:DNA-binding phage protein
MAKTAKKTYNDPIAKEYRAIQYDPAMLQINMLLKHSTMNLTQIANKCGVSTQCMRNWRRQKTRRPQALTMRFVLRTLGYEFKIVPGKGHNKPPEE